MLATVLMDAAMAGAAAAGGEAFRSERVDPAVIGRWGRGLLSGRWRHLDANREEPNVLDLPAGMVTTASPGSR